MRTRIIAAFACFLSASACEPEIEMESRIAIGSANSQVSEAPAGFAAEPSETRELPSGACDPNYTPCVPVARDVDCLGGGGDGPAYVRGPVRVIGRDIYVLDRDGDRVACDR